jgi:osmotically-inducible protein OsmY
MRALVRALLVVVLLAAAGFVVLGYWTGSLGRSGSESPVGTSGVDVDRARERGAEIGERAAVATEKIQSAMGDAALTTKIKAKMALDDTVKARAIDVTTDGSTVTLSGTVHSEAERDRAMALAQETTGVSRVVDHLAVRNP